MFVKRVVFFILLVFSMSLFSQDYFSVYFESDKHELDGKQKERLNQWLLNNKDSKIVAINGYTDQDGTDHYNDILSQKRVDYIIEFVKDRVMMRADFKSRSYGERFSQSESKSENRRVTIYYLTPEELPREDEILGLTGVKEEAENITENKRAELPESAPLSEKIKYSEVGDLLVLKHILFYKNTFAVRKESSESMKELLNVMIENPKLKIRIHGHICCMKKDYRKLSYDRAKQVKRFLVHHGITSQRVGVIGHGVKKPIYPIPEKNQDQAAANRRVEIEILDK